MLLSGAGSSCSGKTTAARACAGMDGLVVHDFDEIGVPSSADVAWRQESLETWLRPVLDHHPRWTVTVIDTTGRAPAQSGADLATWVARERR